MDYSEDASSSTGGDLGFHGESSFNQSDPALKKMVLSLRPGEVSRPIPVRSGGYVILKLIAKESAGQRELSDPQVQNPSATRCAIARNSSCASPISPTARDESHVVNYLARQVLESAGKLPSAEPTK